MKHVDKSKVDIPESLKPATSDFFKKNDEIPVISQNTHNVRVEMVRQGKYDEKADKRYKYDDVKDTLVENLYKRKCAYCESKTHYNDLHVEHYRPKNGYPPKGKNAGIHQTHGGYYWLSLSWDNLLISCSDCNTNKGSKFDINGTRTKYDAKDHNGWKKIHELADVYDEVEQPLMINPEKDYNPSANFEFDINGHMKGVNNRGRYTCDVCKLDRNELVDDRVEILNDFKRSVEDVLANNIGNNKHAEIQLEAIIREFKNELNDDSKPFYAFRQQILKNKWARDVVIGVIQGTVK